MQEEEVKRITTEEVKRKVRHLSILHCSVQGKFVHNLSNFYQCVIMPVD